MNYRHKYQPGGIHRYDNVQVSPTAVDTSLGKVENPDMSGSSATITLPEKKDDKFNPLFALRGFSTGLAWLSGKLDRNRQDQYMLQQMSTLGQMDPTSVDNFQPNPYNLYAKHGGKLQLGGLPQAGKTKIKGNTFNFYGVPQQQQWSPFDDLLALKGTQNPDFMSVLQGMGIPQMQTGGLAALGAAAGQTLSKENTPLMQIQRSFNNAYRAFDKYDQGAKTYDSTNYKDAIKLTAGKFNSASVPKAMIADAVRAGKNNEVDPYDVLGLIGQESTFGHGYARRMRGRGENEDGRTFLSQREMISGWNLIAEPKGYELFLADKKVPGTGVRKDKTGWYGEIKDEKAVADYLQKHPELVEEYKKTLPTYSGAPDYFDMAAKFIKQKGLAKYNPGDPHYVDDVANSKKQLMQDPALREYIASNKFRKGGKYRGKC